MDILNQERSKIQRFISLILLVCWVAFLSEGRLLAAEDAPVGHDVLALVQDPKQPDVLYAGSFGYGILKTEDGGKKWSMKMHGLTNSIAHALVIDPKSPRILYFASAGAGIFRTNNGAESWEAVNNGLWNTTVRSLTIHPDRPEILAAGTSSEIFITHTGGASWEGTHWSKGSIANDPRFFFLTPDSDRLLMGTKQGIFEYAKGQWSGPVLPNANVLSFTKNDLDHSLYIGTMGQGVYRSDDQGATWKPFVQPAVSNWINGVLFDPKQPGRIFLATSDKGVVRSDDGGLTWAPHNQGLTETDVQALVMDPQNPQKLLAGVYGTVGLFRSEDGGEHWTALKETPVLTVSQIVSELDRNFKETARKTSLQAPSSFSKCGSCHGWIDPKLNTIPTYWRMALNPRDWTKTVGRMAPRAKLTEKEVEEVTAFLNQYTYVEPLSLRESGETFREICSQCHALRINGDCVTGDCDAIRTFHSSVRQWPGLVHWLRNFIGCKMTDTEQEQVIRYLNGRYPWKPTDLSWEKTGFVPGSESVEPISSENGPLSVMIGKETYLSSDGKEWSKKKEKTSDVPAGPTATFEGPRYARLDAGALYLSSDLRHWEAKKILPGHPVSAEFVVGFADALFLGTKEGELYKSSDAAQWEKVTGPPQKSTSAASFTGKLFAATTSGEIWVLQGAPWRKKMTFSTLPPKSVFSLQLMDRFLYLFAKGEDASRLYRTKEGEYWEEIALPTEKRSSGTVWNNHFYLFTSENEKTAVYRMDGQDPREVRHEEFTVAAERGGQEVPAVAWNGETYTVIWQNDPGIGFYDVFGATVSRSGEVQPKGGRPVSNAEDTQDYSSLAWGKENFLAVWHDSRKGRFEIYGSRIDRSGKVLDPEGIPIAAGSRNFQLPKVVWTGDSFFVVWHEVHTEGTGFDVYGARVSSSGEVLDPGGIPISTEKDIQYNPRIAAGQNKLMVVWADRRNGNFDIYGARVTPSGEVLDRAGIPIERAPNDQVYPAVSWDGTSFWVVWQDMRDSGIYAKRISPEGVVLDPDPIPVANDPAIHAFPNTVCAGGTCILLWESSSHRPGERDLYGRLLLNGKLQPDSFPISTGEGQQRFGAAAFDGERFLVVWEDIQVWQTGDVLGRFIPVPH